MLWTETHLKIIQILIRSDPRSRNEISTEIGFSNPKNISPHIQYLQRSRYIGPGTGTSSNPVYELNRDVDAILHLYHNRHYRSIQEDIRAMDWFLTTLTIGYKSLPEDVYAILLAMGKKSPYFFDNLVTCRNPGELREKYRLVLYPFSFIPGMHEDFEIPLIMHQLYADAIARDMKGGRLADGFCEPLKMIRGLIKGLMEDNNR